MELIKILLLFVIYGLIGFFQAPTLIRGKQWKELTIFVIFYAIAFLLSFLYVLGVTIPSQYVVMKFVAENLLFFTY
jgi:hypothetical protein